VSFLKKIGDVVKDTATTVGSKSADMLETGKLKLHKSQLEGKIKDKKTEIGNIVYEAYKQNTPAVASALEGIYGEIKDLENQIEAIDVKLQKEVEQTTSYEAQTTPSTEKPAEKVFCAECGQESSPGAKFCKNCGKPLQ
jgi:gas vesicle protein